MSKFYFVIYIFFLKSERLSSKIIIYVYLTGMTSLVHIESLQLLQNNHHNPVYKKNIIV